MKDRADKVLVQAGLAPTRSQALLLIEEKVVFYQDKLVLKASQMIDESGLEVRKLELFVGRGAHKIEGALKDFHVDPKELVVADVGASTGGFTDFVLSRGALKVYAIDVGHDQLAQKLREDSRVKNFEGVNIKFPFQLDELVDLAVVDLSFISLKLVLENISNLVKKDGKIIALVKPQFEVGRSGLDKNGIVKNQDEVIKAIDDLYHWCESHGIFIKAFTTSPLLGKSGNREFFFLIDKTLNQHQWIWTKQI